LVDFGGAQGGDLSWVGRGQGKVFGK